MLRIDIKNNEFEIDGNGEDLTIEFAELGRKLVEIMSEKLNVSEEYILNNLFDAIKLSINKNNENN